VDCSQVNGSKPRPVAVDRRDGAANRKWNVHDVDVFTKERTSSRLQHGPAPSSERSIGTRCPSHQRPWPSFVHIVAVESMSSTAAWRSCCAGSRSRPQKSA
jgi:hypothetical protein